MIKLDFTKPYADLINVGGARYEQNNRYFLKDGTLSQVDKTGYIGDPQIWRQKKRICYFVMGNAGSCTRLVTRILCSDPKVKTWGSIALDTPLSEQVKKDELEKVSHDKIAFKHDGGMGHHVLLKDVSEKVRRGGFGIFWIFLIRRPSKYELIYYEQPLHEYMKIIKPGDQYIIWDSSLMFLDTDNYLREMGQVLHLDFSKAEKINNPDLKWIKANVAT